MLPGRRDALGRLDVTTDPVGSTSTFQGGIAVNALGQVHITDVIPPVGGFALDLSNLYYSAIPEKGDVTPSMTRATVATCIDSWGKQVTCLAGELRFPGARRVRNLVATTSEDFTNAAWAKSFAGTGTIPVVTAGAADPNGGTGACRLQANRGAGTTAGDYSFIRNNLGGSAPLTLTSALWIKSNTGSDQVLTFRVGNGASATVTATNVWQRLEATILAATVMDIGTYGTDPTTASLDILIYRAQCENVTGQSVQTAGDYVSVGVESAPAYHGSMVDGVKCFPVDLSGNPLPTAATYDAVSLNGVAGTYVSTPDSVAASITGDIDIRVRVAMADWMPAADMRLVCKRNVTAAYDFYLAATTGLLAFYDGDTSFLSSVAPAVSDGETLWCRLTVDVDNGVGSTTVTFYTSADGVSWTQLGIPIVGGTAGALNDTTDPVTLGMYGNGISSPLAGKIYQAQIYNGINGTLAVDFDASRYLGRGTTLTGSTGEVWTLQGNAKIHPTNFPMTTPLIELAATNLCLQSNAFTTTWATTGTISVTQDAVGPDGATSAWTLTDSDAAAISGIYQGIALTSGSTYTASFFVKKTTGAQASYPVVLINNGATGGAQVTIDTSNGIATIWTAITGVTVVTSSARCESFNSDLWRVSVTLACNSTATWNVVIYPAATATANKSSGSLTEVALTGSAVFYGAQVELGTAATSYIATTTAAVTRNADQFYYTGALIGTLKAVAAVDFKRDAGFANNGAIVALSNGAVNGSEYFILESASALAFYGWDTAQQWNQQASNAYTPSTLSSVAQSFTTNDIKMSKDGVTQTPDTVATIPTVTRLEYGMVAGANQLNGYPGIVYGSTAPLLQSDLDKITAPGWIGPQVSPEQPNFVNGYMVSNTGQLVTASAPIDGPYLGGYPRKKDGRLIIQTDTVPAATDPFVGGICVGSTGGIYTTLVTPPVGDPPFNTLVPHASGTGQIGAVLSCTTGTWFGTPTITYTYRWYRDNTPIIGAIASTYTVDPADVGATLICAVTAVNALGGATEWSNPVEVVYARYNYFTNSSATPPVGQIMCATGGLFMRVNEIDLDGIDRSIAIATLKAGDKIIVGTQVGVLASTPGHNSGVWSIPLVSWPALGNAEYSVTLEYA